MEGRRDAYPPNGFHALFWLGDGLRFERSLWQADQCCRALLCNAALKAFPVSSERSPRLEYIPPSGEHTRVR